MEIIADWKRLPEAYVRNSSKSNCSIKVRDMLCCEMNKAADVRTFVACAACTLNLTMPHLYNRASEDHCCGSDMTSTKSNYVKQYWTSLMQTANTVQTQ